MVASPADLDTQLEQWLTEVNATTTHSTPVCDAVWSVIMNGQSQATEAPTRSTSAAAGALAHQAPGAGVAMRAFTRCAPNRRSPGRRPTLWPQPEQLTAVKPEQSKAVTPGHELRPTD
jgi:hypothetical protein